MIDRFLRWLRRPVTIVWLIAAAGLMVVGHYLDAHGGLDGLRRFTAYLERSLGSFDALHVGTMYIKDLTGCDLVTEPSRVALACPPARSGSDRLQGRLRGETEPGLITGMVMAVGSTLTRLWREATWLGAAIHLLLLGAAVYWLARTLDVTTGGPFSWLLCLALTPVVASVVALGLKWFLLLLVVLFSQALAGVAWVLATFPTAIKWLARTITLVKTAQDVESVATGVSAGGTSGHPPGA
jgi:hypothetical protein